MNMNMNMNTSLALVTVSAGYTQVSLKHTVGPLNTWMATYEYVDLNEGEAGHCPGLLKERKPNEKL